MKNKNPFKRCYLYFKESFSTPLKKKIFFEKLFTVFINIVKYAFMIGITFIILYPLFLQLAVAFREPLDVNNPEIMWIPERFSLQNFKIAFTALNYWKALGNTFFNSLIVSLLQVISTALAGYAFGRIKFRGSKILFFLSVFTIIVPQTMVSLPMYISFAKEGLVGNKFVLFLMAGLGMGIKSGIFIYLYRQAFKGLPPELEEAAYMDGCNVFQVFRRIMFPCVRSTTVVVFILAFVWQWNDFYYTNLFYVNGSVDSVTLATQLQSIANGGSLQQILLQANIWQLMGQDVTSNPLFVSMILNTAGMLVMLPVLILYFFVQKLFVEGIEKSGIVG